MPYLTINHVDKNTPSIRDVIPRNGHLDRSRTRTSYQKVDRSPNSPSPTEWLRGYDWSPNGIHVIRVVRRSSKTASNTKTASNRHMAKCFPERRLKNYAEIFGTPEYDGSPLKKCGKVQIFGNVGGSHLFCVCLFSFFSGAMMSDLSCKNNL